jgi:outer membrane protein
MNKDNHLIPCLRDRIMHLLIPFLCICFYTFPASAHTITLTLNDAINLSLNNGYDAQQLRLQLESAKHNMDVNKRISKTRVNLNLQTPNFSENVQAIQLPNQLPIYNTVGTLSWKSTLQLTQPILLTNGSLTLSSDFEQRRESVFQEQRDATDRSKRFLSSIRVRFNQPLFVPNQLKLDLESAQLQLTYAQETYTSSQLNVIYNVTNSFYNTYSAQRRLEIAQEALTQQIQSTELAQKKYEAGLIPEVEALQMEVTLARSRNQLLQAQGNFTRQSDALKLELGLALEDTLSVNVTVEITPLEIDEAIAISHVLRHRASLRQFEINQRLSEIALQETRANGAIRGDLSASYERAGFTSALPEDTSTRSLFDASWEDLRRRQRNLGLQFSLTVPLWDSDLNRARVARAQTQLDRNKLTLENERKEVLLTIRNTIGRLRETQSRLDVLKQSEKVAQRSYEIDLARFENGDIAAQDLTRTRDDLTQARQNYLEAYIQYQIAIADLKRQTLYDFENNKSLAEE